MKQITYRFEWRGMLNGKHAFDCVGLDGLRDKRESIDSRGGGFSTGIITVEHLGDWPGDEHTMVSQTDYTGSGWYTVRFDGVAQKHPSESVALIAFIEDRTETRQTP